MADRKTWKHIRRADNNQASLVVYLRRFGVRVAITNMVGFGFPDLVCSFRGITFLFEVKQPGGKLRTDQVKFHRNWDGPIHTVETGQQALGVVLAHVAGTSPHIARRADLFRRFIDASSEADIAAAMLQIGNGSPVTIPG